MVKDFKECIARPDEGERKFLLTDHLLAVGNHVGAPAGEYRERLQFLAGLLHDIGKARNSWQLYVRDPSRESVQHAIVGGILFGYLAVNLLNTWQNISGNERRALEWQTVCLIRDIMDHHTSLKDIEEGLPWQGSSVKQFFIEMDLESILIFIKRYFPELTLQKLSVKEIATWNREFRKIWEKIRQENLRLTMRLTENELAERAIRADTANVIQSDRFDAAGIKGAQLAESRKGLQELENYITGKIETNEAPLSTTKLRQKLQTEAVSRYLDSDALIFLLKLPTGMGKTLTALRLALLGCAQKDQRRIIYVAPYLSILAQVTEEIRKATGLEVMQHHSLMWASNDEWDEKLALTVESWQMPIVTTTFNQFFRALFPARAQQTLRILGMKGAIILIDEPQVIGHKKWMLFLRMLEAAVQKLEAQVIFISATPPSLKALKSDVVLLSPKEIDYTPRYKVVKIEEGLSEGDLAGNILPHITGGKSISIILNTIWDSLLVYKEIEKLDCRSDLKKYELIHLHGMMTPLHKLFQIERIKKCLKHKQKVIVVSTQIIEAGLDFSFEIIYRALPIYPSLVQTAGRLNRHGEKDGGVLYFFSFLRKGERETRQWVYREKKSRDITDELINDACDWDELQFMQNTETYFKRLADEATSDYLKPIREAVSGKWSSLAGITPFEEDDSRISVFVPWGEDYLPDYIHNRLEKWGITNLEELYERYLNKKWIAGLSFIQRKQFIGIIQQFIVPLSRDKVLKVIRGWNEDVAIQQATGLEHYSPRSGYAELFTDRDETDIV